MQSYEKNYDFAIFLEEKLYFCRIILKNELFQPSCYQRVQAIIAKNRNPYGAYVVDKA